MSFANVITEIQADLASVITAGDEPIPAYPPDSINAFPLLVVYPQPGEYTIQASNNATGQSKYGGQHIIVVEWMDKRDDLARVIAAAIPIADAIPLALFNGFRRDKYSGTVHHLNSVTCDLFGPSQWDSTETFNVRYLVNVTIVETTTV
jgi:hypothetical protein